MIRKENSIRSCGILITVLLLNCGGSTAGTGQKTTAGQSDSGGNTSTGNSTGASTTTTASGTGGGISSTTGNASSTTSTSSTTGSTSSTTGNASSTTGSASSTTGNTSSATGNASTTGSTNPGWAACNGPGQCEIDVPGCCGICRVPTIDDVIGVAVSHQDEFRMATCPAPTPCPACATLSNPDLAARCVSGSCAAFDVSKDPGLSGCMSDSDCVLRAGLKCCALGPDWVAVRTDAEAALAATLCAPGGACAAIAPVPPPTLAAVCSAGACTVAATGPTGVVDAGPACAPATCTGVNLNPPELTFEAAYCNGSMCAAMTQSACEAIDVVTDCNTLTSGSDGRPDCRWAMTNAGFSCQINK